jgi:lantibiotic biosynthesis protein
VPGGPCLYAKLYTGTATADRILREVVAPLASEAIACGDASHWFFIRYHDPQSHLRIRFFGEPAALYGRVLPALDRAAAPLLDDGSIWKIQLDTYDREVERYGGPAGIELAEKLFWYDSDAVTEIVSLLPGDTGADLRWLVALRGTEQILVDAGLDDAARLEAITRSRDNFDREHRTGTDFHKQLGERYRARKADIERVMTMTGTPAHEDDALAHAIAAIERRTARSAPVLAELRARDAAGQLRPTLRGMAWSLVHMHVNRLMHASQRAQELVIYDFLRRWHMSRRAHKPA